MPEPKVSNLIILWCWPELFTLLCLCFFELFNPVRVKSGKILIFYWLVSPVTVESSRGAQTQKVELFSPVRSRAAVEVKTSVVDINTAVKPVFSERHTGAVIAYCTCVFGVIKLRFRRLIVLISVMCS
jgi:hypothetical protein